MLLEDLFGKNGDSEKRDCLYYLAIGNARIKVRFINTSFFSYFGKLPYLTVVFGMHSKSILKMVHNSLYMLSFFSSLNLQDIHLPKPTFQYL